jgi:putative spermidine/putrescine transport system permease protein
MQRKLDLGAKIISYLVYFFLAAPLIIIILASFSPTAYLKFPPEEFSLRWYKNIFNSFGFVEGFINSMVLACLTTSIDLVIGISAGLCIAKYKFKGKEFLTNFFTSPMFLPAITFGFVLLQVFSMFFRVPAFVKLTIGHCVIILPYIVRNVISVSIGFNWKLEEAARSLGANAFQTFSKITLPLIRPGVIAGALLSFLYSLDDATLAPFLTEPGFVTLPVRMLTYMEFAFDPTLAAISTVLIVLSVSAIIIMEKFVGLDMFLK